MTPLRLLPFGTISHIVKLGLLYHLVVHMPHLHTHSSQPQEPGQTQRTQIHLGTFVGVHIPCYYRPDRNSKGAVDTVQRGLQDSLRTKSKGKRLIFQCIKGGGAKATALSKTMNDWLSYSTGVLTESPLSSMHATHYLMQARLNHSDIKNTHISYGQRATSSIPLSPQPQFLCPKAS